MSRHENKSGSWEWGRVGGKWGHLAWKWRRRNSLFGGVGEMFGGVYEMFGSTDEIFGSADEIFGSADEMFGSADETFGSADETFGNADEMFGSVDRMFGSVDEMFGGVDEMFRSVDEAFGSVDGMFGSVGEEKATCRLLRAPSCEPSWPPSKCYGATVTFGPDPKIAVVMDSLWGCVGRGPGRPKAYRVQVGKFSPLADDRTDIPRSIYRYRLPPLCALFCLTLRVQSNFIRKISRAGEEIQCFPRNARGNT